MGYDLGVDLGTTFVAAAIARNGRTQMCTLGNQTVVSPSVVYLNESSQLVFGEAAERRGLSHPDRVERAFKRRLGDPTPVVLGGVPYPVTALMAAQLQDVLSIVTRVEGGPPDRVGLTFPANWGPYRQELFEEIPQLAGLRNYVTLREPVAAAAYYGAARTLADGDSLAVYDLGGGTFDATVLRKQNGVVEVAGDPDGIERLGGIDFDEAIIQWLNFQHGGALAELDMSDPRSAAALAKLRQECVQAKEALSVDTETTIPVLLPSRHFFARLTRREFESMIRAPVESTIGTLIRAVHTARMDVRELSSVLLIGGSSRIPLVEQMIAEEIGRPTVADAHPKYAVALGAAGVAAPRPVSAGLSVAAGSRPAEPGPGPASGMGSDPAPAPETDRRSGRPPVSASRVPRQAGQATPSTDVARPRPWLLPALAAFLVVVLLVGGLAFLTRRTGRRAADPPASATTTSPGSSTVGSPTSAPPPPVAAALAVPSLGKTIKLPGSAPVYVAASPNGHQLYIADGNQTLSVLDTSTDQITQSNIRVDGPAQFLSFSPDGRYAYVSLWDRLGGSVHAVSILDTEDNHIAKTIQVRSRPFLAAVTPDGKWLYVPNHDARTVSVIDATTMKPFTEITVPPEPHYVTFSLDGKRAYVADHESGEITVIDTATNKVLTSVRVGAAPHSLEQNPHRPLLMNVNWGEGTVTTIDTTTNRVSLKALPVGEKPLNIHWSPDGRYAYVVNSGDNTLSVVRADDPKVTATLRTGKHPTSIAVLPDGTKGYISNQESDSLTVVNLSG